MEHSSENSVPYFCWDRKLTVRQIKNRLRDARGPEKDQLVSWILREAAFRDVWQYLKPKEVEEILPRIQGRLGRWKGFWNYIFATWHELGKI